MMDIGYEVTFESGCKVYSSQDRAFLSGLDWCSLAGWDLMLLYMLFLLILKILIH